MAKGVVLGDRISEILGRRHSRSTIVSSASLAVICLFYVYTVGTFLQVRIYPLIDRVTYYTQFNFYIVNEFADHVVIGALLILWLGLCIRPPVGRLIVGLFAALFAVVVGTNYDLLLDGVALVALPVIITLIIYNHTSRGSIIREARFGLEMNYLALSALILSCITVAYAIGDLLFQPSDTSKNTDIIRNYGHEIFLLLSIVSPVLVLLVSACIPTKLLFNFVSSILKRNKNIDLPSEEHSKLSHNKQIFYLLLFIVLSLLIAVVPHLPRQNIDNQTIGVDTSYYVSWIEALKNSVSTQDFLYQTFVQQSQGDRPLSLLLLFAIHSVTNTQLEVIIEFMPLLFGPSLVTATYFLTRQLTLNDKTSLFAAFLTSVSSQILVGIYAGFYANWLALILGYFSFPFLFRYLKTGNRSDLIIYTTLVILLLFAHVYTWSVIIASSFIFLTFKLVKSRNSHIENTNKTIRKYIILILLIIFSTIILDISRAVLTGSSGGIDRDLEITRQAIGYEQFVQRWNNLNYTMTVFVGGLLGNSILFVLCLLWIAKTKVNDQSAFLLIFMSLGLLPIIFGNHVVQTRVLYDIPFQIPAAVALSSMISQRHNYNRILIVVSICILFVATALISVSNFYLIPPN